MVKLTHHFDSRYNSFALQCVDTTNSIIRAEETHIEIGDLTYVGSHVVDDWRYRRELDKIVTVFFEGVKIFGKPEPDDDISELRWFKVSDGPVYGHDDLNETDIVAEHRPLFKMLMEKRHANAD